MVPKMVRGFEKSSNPPEAGISVMWRSLGEKNSQDTSTIMVKGVASSAPNAKASKANEGSTTMFGVQHRMSKALASIEFVKEMMEQNSPECPYEYVPGKEFLPDFALQCIKRLLHMRVI